MNTHFTAWLVDDRSCLDQDNCDVTVLADDITTVIDYDGNGFEVEKPEYSSTGAPVFYGITGVDARDGNVDDAIREAEQMLDAAGWVVTGTWEAVGTSYVVEVELADETWGLDQVAAHIGASSTGSARKTLSRWGVQAVSREPGRGGQSLYSKTEIVYARATRPGQGTRTDLKDAG
ncbi:hypothetical protein KCMC57_64170 (plasmid) [Kitasatospora sp. CMC57]|uniref:Uncharacterized protein n=1 Tax=Kitasatospora sp. CMC57 TaxID=3231513 RepID=A0AB33K997_9ACTN